MEYDFLGLLYIFFATVLGETFGTMFGGGSFFIQPALLAAGIEANKAVANDIGAAVFANFTFLWFYRKQEKQLSFSQYKSIALWMAPTLVIGAFIGGNILYFLPDHILKWMIIFICGCGLIYTFMKIYNNVPEKLETKKDLENHWQFYAVLLGLAIGLYDGLSGAGSGILIILGLTLIFKIDMKTVLALANVISAISLGAAALTFLYLGLLSFELLTVMVPAALLAGAFGAKVASIIPEKALRLIYGVLVLTLMVYLIFSDL